MNGTRRNHHKQSKSDEIDHVQGHMTETEGNKIKTNHRGIIKESSMKNFLNSKHRFKLPIKEK